MFNYLQVDENSTSFPVLSTYYRNVFDLVKKFYFDQDPDLIEKAYLDLK